MSVWMTVWFSDFKPVWCPAYCKQMKTEFLDEEMSSMEIRAEDSSVGKGYEEVTCCENWVSSSWKWVSGYMKSAWVPMTEYLWMKASIEIFILNYHNCDNLIPDWLVLLHESIECLRRTTSYFLHHIVHPLLSLISSQRLKHRHELSQGLRCLIDLRPPLSTFLLRQLNILNLPAKSFAKLFCELISR